mmetsp:Transcript_16171/g.40884  ORF Transcript_16171/g.40884 Transcript_16171/m.40884 type:complete len:269 (+) Transcript_16171:257-1063(+)
MLLVELLLRVLELLRNLLPSLVDLSGEALPFLLGLGGARGASLLPLPLAPLLALEHPLNALACPLDRLVDLVDAPRDILAGPEGLLRGPQALRRPRQPHLVPLHPLVEGLDKPRGLLARRPPVRERRLVQVGDVALQWAVGPAGWGPVEELRVLHLRHDGLGPRLRGRRGRLQRIDGHVLRLGRQLLNLGHVRRQEGLHGGRGGGGGRARVLDGVARPSPPDHVPCGVHPETYSRPSIHALLTRSEPSRLPALTSPWPPPPPQHSRQG